MKKHAFTLAEVLVTLGIIGVIAAMTLPTLIKEYQKHVWVNQLKTTYSILEQGFQKMLVDDEVENLSDTTAFQSMKQNYCSGYSANCADFIDNLKNYIPIVSITKVNNYRYNYLNNRGFYEYSGNIIYLKNGAFLFNPPNPMFNKQANFSQYSCQQIKDADGSMCDRQGTIYIDVNGDRGPNQLGRDVYIFYLAGNGHLYGFHGKDVSIYNKLSYDYKTCLRPHCGSKEVIGQGCAARIIQDGWVMNY